MKWVTLACGHSCWVSWLEAFPGRAVLCPQYRGEHKRVTTVEVVYGQLEVVA